MNHYNVYFIPFEIKGPVYLELLKSNINGTDLSGNEYLVKRFSWKQVFLSPYGPRERRVVHIHWETNVYGSKYLLVSLLKMALKFPGFWILKKFRGVKIIWTMHNLHSHDYPHPKIDNFGRSLMWRLAQKVLLHEKTFADSELKKRKDKDIECIPPGNYIGSYGPLWQGDRDSLRKEYGLNPQSIVLLSLGSVRPYKALPPLIEAVIEASKRGINIELLITGKATQEMKNEIENAVGNSESVKLQLNYIDDADIAKLHGLADYSALYYGDSALGSAAILLSLSYGVPVITRNFAVSELIIPGKNGFKFQDKEDLLKVLLSLPDIKPFDRQVVMDTVVDWDWKKMGEATRLAYNSLYK